MSLRFVRRDTFFSIYRNAAGAVVLKDHGILTRYDFTPETVAHFWDRFMLAPDHSWRSFADFQQELADRLVDPDEVDDLVCCDDCQKPQHPDSGERNAIDDGNRIVCDECLGNYCHCGDCDWDFESTTITLNGTEVCDRCRERNWSYCDDCDGYYPNADGCSRSHGCECEAPHQRFTMPNLTDVLHNDERATVELPAGVISDVGLYHIATLLREHSSRHWPCRACWRPTSVRPRLPSSRAGAPLDMPAPRP